MKVVGACLARTGTHSLKVALERLLGEPCYHMWETIEHPDHFPVWLDAVRGHRPDWRAFLRGYGAAVDEPTAHFWHELSEAFPDSLILLSARDPDDWWRSATKTVLPFVASLPSGPMKDLLNEMWSPEFSFDRYDEEAAKAGYKSYVEHVRTTAPAHRLIDWTPGAGWAPICEALGRPVPREPFPHLNTTVEFLSAAPERLTRLRNR